MNDEEFELEVARVEAMCARWFDLVVRDSWQVTHRYHRGIYQVDDGASPTRNASTVADWRYGHATVEWNLERLSRLTDAALEWTVVHEFCHIVFSELRHGINDEAWQGDRWIVHEEHVATVMARAFIAARDAGAVPEHEHRYFVELGADQAVCIDCGARRQAGSGEAA